MSHLSGAAIYLSGAAGNGPISLRIYAPISDWLRL
jgi:hypothetical protein